MRILVTRPQPDADATAARLRALGHMPLVAPVSRVEPAPGQLPAPDFAAVIVSSANALRFLSRDDLAPFAGIPAFAVGSRSAEQARIAGFARVREAGGDGAALVSLLSGVLHRTARVLYLAGEPRKARIEEGLSRAGFQLVTVVTYRMIYRAEMPENAVLALMRDEIDAVLHFSRKGAETFAAQLGALELPGRDRLLHVCLSEDVASGLAGLNRAKIAVSTEPTEMALFTAVDKGR